MWIGSARAFHIGPLSYHRPTMAETGATLTEQLDELGAQLDWVREYL
jgi:hypothetical protein